MKFVALALALLLAVGTQSASLQADAPTQLAHLRAAFDVFLGQVKDSANRALDQLDDTEYRDMKLKLSQNLDTMYTQIKAMQGAVSPVTDNVVATIADATADLRTSLMADVEALKTELEPKRVELRDVVNKHIEEYRALLQPILSDYQTRHTAEMEALRLKLEPVLEDMRQKVTANLEETKSVLIPMLEHVRSKISERVEALKVIASPYVEEYKEQLKQVYSQAQSIDAQDLSAMREKILPLVDDIKVKLHTIFETIAATVTKS